MNKETIDDTKNRAKLAEKITDAFFNSSDLAEKIQAAITSTPCSPLELCFAMLVVDRGIAAQIKDWPDIKVVCGTTFGAMDRNGMLPAFNQDGSVTPPKFEGVPLKKKRTKKVETQTKRRASSRNGK